MNVEKDAQQLRELGAKLANFRHKLAVAIGQKKITQLEFGDMYGGYSSRQITSYERGEVDPPGSLLFQLWKQGNSIDDIFNERPISDGGREIARKLYQASSFVSLRQLDNAAQERALREVVNAKRVQVGTTKEIAPKSSGKRKAGHHPSRTNKRRRG